MKTICSNSPDLSGTCVSEIQAYREALKRYASSEMSHVAVEVLSKYPERKPFGLSEIDIKGILSRTLKPEEISGDPEVQLDRITELIKWFKRYAEGQANPKWFQDHAFELVYYIAKTSANRFIDLEAVQHEAFFEGLNVTPELKSTYLRLIALDKEKAPD